MKKIVRIYCEHLAIRDKEENDRSFQLRKTIFILTFSKPN